MTDKQLKSETLAQMNDVILHHIRMGIGLNEAKLQQQAAGIMRRLSRFSRNSEEMVQRVLPEVSKSISEKIISLTKREKVCDLNFTVAKSLLKETFDSIQFPYRLEQQLYRVKVSVMLNDKRIVTFFMRYKTLDRDLENMAAAVVKLKQVVDVLGNEMKVQKSGWQGGWIFPEKNMD